MRILIVFFIVISVVIALDPPTFIAQLMGISWGALAGSFLAPFCMDFTGKGPPERRFGQALQPA
jgi:SSS family solute:Na+ symporter